MKPEFIVERQGRRFVLYSGLLAMAHERGLLSIRTNLIQIPNEQNGRVAIVQATVVLLVDGREWEFQGLGDAAPNNVASAMLNCTIRLAETRAKARALRDAVNVGMCAWEELGDDEVMEVRASTPNRGRAVGSRVQGRQKGEVPTAMPSIAPAIREMLVQPGGVSMDQMEAMSKIAHSKRVDLEAFAQQQFGVSVAMLSNVQACEVIKSLQRERIAA